MTQRTDAIAYLQKEIGPIPDTTASALCDALEDLSIAMHLTVRLIQQKQLSAREYLELFLQKQTELLSKGNPPAQYPILIAASLSADNLSSDSSLIACMASIVAPTGIPLALFDDWGSIIPAKTPQQRAQLAAISSQLPTPLINAKARQRTIAQLAHAGLIEVSEDALSFTHPLIQIAFRRILSRPQLMVFAELLLIKFTDLEAQDNDATFGRIFPHLEALVSFLESIPSHHKRAGELLMASGAYFLSKNNLIKARELCLRALPHLKTGTPVSEVLIRTYQVLGSIFYNKEEEGARELFEAALELTPKPLPVSSASTLFYLGEVLYLEDNAEESKKLLIEALSLFEQDLSIAPGLAFSCAASLGRILQLDGDDEEAEQLLLRSFQFPRGKEHPGTEVLALSVLAHAQMSLGKYEEARHPIAKIIRELEPHADEVAPLLGMALGDMAEVHYHTNELEEARNTVMRAISLVEGSEHEKGASFTLILLSAGRILREYGDSTAARAVLQRALEQGDDAFDEEIQEELTALDSNRP